MGKSQDDRFKKERESVYGVAETEVTRGKSNAEAVSLHPVTDILFRPLHVEKLKWWPLPRPLCEVLYIKQQSMLPDTWDFIPPIYSSNPPLSNLATFATLLSLFCGVPPRN